MTRMVKNHVGLEGKIEKKVEKLLDEQTNVILHAVRDIVEKGHNNLDNRVSALETQVTRLANFLEHYILCGPRIWKPN